MNFPKFWAKGTHQGFIAWRWSDLNLAEAETLAKEAARRVAERFARDELHRQRYAYADRPLREPVLREFRDAAGQLAAAITRNSYGCLVLNTARLMFVDVDFPEPQVSLGSWFKRLFGKAEPASDNKPETHTLAQAEAWAQRNPGWGWRVYRTRAGMRLMATHALFEPDAASTLSAFDALGSDPLYRQLCKIQKCFRARLTPKPWRCDLPNPPSRWPWTNAKEEALFHAWERDYLQACGEFATCTLVASFGSKVVHPEVQELLKVHDETTRAQTKVDLA